MMMAVILRGRACVLAEAYGRSSARFRDPVLPRYGCLGLHAGSQDDEGFAVPLWPSAAHFEGWRNGPEHAQAQRIGCERRYAGYTVQIAEVRNTHVWSTASCA